MKETHLFAAALLAIAALPFGRALRASDGPATADTRPADPARREAWAGAELEPIALAVVDDDEKSLKAMLDAGADPNQTVGKLHTPLLTLACSESSKNTAWLLLEYGADFDKPNDWGLTPLHAAAMADAALLAAKLAKSGANLEAKAPGIRGATPLHVAAIQGAADTVGILLHFGASVDALRNEDGKTALHIAAEHDRARVAQLLLGNRADTTIRDKNGELAIDYARRFPKTIKVFEEALKPATRPSSTEPAAGKAADHP